MQRCNQDRPLVQNGGSLVGKPVVFVDVTWQSDREQHNNSLVCCHQAFCHFFTSSHTFFSPCFN